MINETMNNHRSMDNDIHIYRNFNCQTYPKKKKKRERLPSSAYFCQEYPATFNIFTRSTRLKGKAKQSISLKIAMPNISQSNKPKP